jgi:hypothetical protein
LVPDAGAIPTEPQLWLINPATHLAAKYPSAGSTLADLTHAALEAWLARNGVTRPRDAPIIAEAAFLELARLERQTNQR